MKQENIHEFKRKNWIKSITKNPSKIKSLIEAAKLNSVVAKEMPLDDKHTTSIFREVYESIRQLGDALWLSNGYETQNHEVSLEILKEIEIKEKIKILSLDRFREIRHDANYRGYLVSIEQAKEILDFWDNCSEDIIKVIREKNKEGEPEIKGKEAKEDETNSS